VHITDKGLQMLNKIAESQKEFEKQFQTLTKTEAAQLSAMLDKLRG
jgi:DNA-binding MarR family transcriptional regulator